jgi:hypothetical protein
VTDIILYERPVWGLNDIIIGPHVASAGITMGAMIDTLAKKRARFQPRPDELRDLVVESQSLMGTLTEQYGEYTARYVYYRMKQNQLGPFKPGAKYGTHKR